MFRFVASTSGSSLRPVLLRNARPNTGSLILPNSDREVKSQIRTYSSVLSKEPVATKRQGSISSSPYSAGESPETESGLVSTFLDLMKSVSREQSNKCNVPENVGALFEMFQNDELKSKLSRDDISKYVDIINMSAYRNRVSRLSQKMNRDSDQYKSKSLYNDVLLKNAILNLADFISDKRFDAVVKTKTVRQLFLAMSQFDLPHELIKTWEQGVNSEKGQNVYLQQQVLSVVLPIAYDKKRFTYEQIVRLYEGTLKSTSFRYHDLLTSIGKIAINEGDYPRALDSLDQLLNMYSQAPNPELAGRSLAELHLCFIGRSKDVKIAKRFFDKVVNQEVPYPVALKAPHVASLLENCEQANESFETIIEIWKNTVSHYAGGKAMRQNHSRDSIINKMFFSIFFRKFPKLTQESYSQLKEVISIHASIKMDELFLNNIISNYSWGDKTVFLQLIENYAIYNVEQTQVAHRVALKQIGSIENFEDEEIVEFWNASLVSLEKSGCNYIPIADWAALRDATILSRFGAQREKLYLALLATYKNFHQDTLAVDRFVKYWSNNAKSAVVARVATENEDVFTSGFAIQKPELVNLRENVDYKAAAQHMMSVLHSKK